MRRSEKCVEFSLSQGVDASWPRGGAGRGQLIRLRDSGPGKGEAASGGRASSSPVSSFDRLRGERRRGAPDLPEPSGEGGEGGYSEAAIGGAAPGRQVASILRSAGFTGDPRRRTAPLERSRSRQGQGQVPPGAWSNTAADTPLGGAETGPTRVGRTCFPRQCNSRISLGTLFLPSRCSFPSFSGDLHTVIAGSPLKDSGYITVSRNCAR